jgi:amino acid permease
MASEGAILEEEEHQYCLIEEDEDQCTKHTDSIGIASIPSSVLAVICVSCGGGTLSIPYAIQGSGVVFGALLLILISVCTTWASQMIIVTAKRSNLEFPRMPELVRAYLGKKFEIGLMTFQTIYTFFVCVGYLILDGDIVPDLIRHFTELSQGRLVNVADFNSQVYMQRWFAMLAPQLLTVIAASQKTMDSLKYTSLFSLGCILFLVITVMVKFFQRLGSDDSAEIAWSEVNLFSFSPNTLVAISLISSNYFMLFNVLPISYELKDPVKKRMNTVLYSGEVITSLIYMIPGLLAYVMFPNTVKGNVLLNFGDSDILVVLSKSGLLVTLISTSSLIVFSLRSTTERYLFPAKPYSFVRSFSLVLTIFALAFISAFQIPNIVSVYSFLGSIFCNSLAFILPPVLYLKQQTCLHKRSFASIFMKPISTGQRLATVLLIFGVLSTVMCTGASIWHAIYH